MLDPNIKVLIVDEHKTMLHILRSLLEQIGFKDINQASDGAKALEMFKAQKYGLIISEWTLEGISGYDFLQTVRKSENNKDVPFIILAADSTPQNVIKAKEAGVSHYILKPFTLEILQSKIKAVFR